ncbi:MAG: hypothetical protein AAGH79_08890 [Bacteroidota bacterium]
MLASLGCVAILCVVLKEKSGNNVFLGEMEEVQGLGVLAGQFLIDQQEVRPMRLKDMINRYDWSFFTLMGNEVSLQANKDEIQMPVVKPLQKVGDEQVWMFSRWDFKTIDTLHLQNDYAWHVQTTDSPIPIDLLVVRTTEVNNPASYQLMRDQLSDLTTYIATFKRPFLVLGQFNTHPWSKEKEQVVRNGQLKDSRQGFAPTIPHGKITIWEIPQDHILYSKEFICQEFSTLSTAEYLHLGIMAKLVLYPNRFIRND